jgi:hypothetical protein
LEVKSVEDVSEGYALMRITEFLGNETTNRHIQPDIVVQLQRLEKALKAASTSPIGGGESEIASHTSSHQSPPPQDSRTAKREKKSF